MRRFSKLELVEDALPDETTILNFRRMVEKHKLSEVIFNNINAYLIEKGISVSHGSMVDATLIQPHPRLKTKAKRVTLRCTQPVKTSNIILV